MKHKDENLQHRVQEMLANDKDLKGYGLNANVVDGQVQVSGIVDTLSEQKRLKEKLANLQGVKSVELGLAVSTDGAIDDKSVTSEVMEELDGNPRVNLRHVGAKSVDGTVFLMGTVDNPEEKQAAIASAQKARGVKNVISQVKVRSGGGYDESLESVFHSQVNNDQEDEGETRIF